MSRALVTGSNKGIGLGLCRALAADGWDVIATCRRSSPELEALPVHVVEGIDVADPASAGHLRDAAGGDPIELLAVNAGVNVSFESDGVSDLDLSLVEQELRVNTLGAARTALAVLPSLLAGSKILFVSSSAGAPGQSSFGHPGYATSKVALNAFARFLADDLRDSGIVVAIVSPGATDTDIMRRVLAASPTQPPPGFKGKDPLESAQNLLAIAERATIETWGTFWGPDGGVILTPDGRPA